MTLLKKVAEGKQHYRNGQKIVFDICATRWVENVDDYEKFLSAIVYIVAWKNTQTGESGMLYHENVQGTFLAILVNILFSF